jgi:hypothetical protein
MLEEAAPARLVLLGAFADAENLPIPIVVDANRNQQRHVAHLAGPAALKHDAVEIHVGMLALDRLSITHNFGSDSGSQRDVGQAR